MQLSDWKENIEYVINLHELLLKVAFLKSRTRTNCWVRVLRPFRYKICHFGHALPSDSG